LAYQDITTQLHFLIPNSFLIKHPYFYLKEFPRYLQAILIRLEKIHTHTNQDEGEYQKIQELENAWFKLYEKQTPKLDLLNLSQSPNWQHLLEYRYALEELRVAIFANALKTRQIISYKRLQKQLFEMMH
jgi:ATP-dependent helicase HrpA